VNDAVIHMHAMHVNVATGSNHVVILGGEYGEVYRATIPVLLSPNSLSTLATKVAENGDKL